MSWRALAIAATAVLLALAFTAPIGSANQATYLLDPLHRAEPELFTRDWFVATPPYLPAFGWLAQWLYRLDPEGVVAMLAAHVLVMIAIYIALAWLVDAVSTDLRAFWIVAGFSTLTMGRAMGGSYLFTPYLQPSSLATLGWLVALAALVRGRYLVCGIALALAGAVHPNFLVLGLGLFAIAGLARRGVGVRAVSLFVPQLIVLACVAPDLWAAAGASDEAVRILVEFHAPGHYAGSHLAVRIPELALWLVAAFAALRALSPQPALRAVAPQPALREVSSQPAPAISPQPALTILWRFAVTAAALAIVTAALATIPALQGIAQVRWARVAPFGQLACQVIVVVALVQHVRWTVAAWSAPAIVATFFYLHASPFAIALAACIFALALVRHTATVLAIAVILAALWIGPHGRGLTGRREATPSELALATWARDSTAVDALFVVPPELGRFRLLARRSIVVDLKSPPLRSDLLVAWYRRLCALVLAESVRTQDVVVARYAKLSPSELVTVAHHFAANYVVVRVPATGNGPAVYANDVFAVYRVP